MNFTIDAPPMRTGNVKEDLEQLYNYIEELTEELEYRFSEVSDNE